MKTEDIYQDIIERLSQIREDKLKLIEVLTLLEEQVLRGSKYDKQTQITDEYEDTITQITDSVDQGFVVYLNPDTMEIEQSTNMGLYDSIESDEQNEDMLDEYGMNYPKWDRYIRFEPFNRADLISRMEKFITQLGNRQVREELDNMTDDEWSVTHFDRIISHANCWEDWLDFKKREIEDYVRNQFTSGIHRRQTMEDAADLSSIERL